MREMVIEKDGKPMRCGVTTGSCAALAARAAASLLAGRPLETVSLTVPKGVAVSGGSLLRGAEGRRRRP